MSLPSPYEDWPPAEDTPDMAFIHRKSALEHGYTQLEQAYQLEETTGGVYVRSAAVDTPLEEAHAILLTRDGQTPQFEESKEQLYLFFPPRELTAATTESLMIWIEHLTAEGESRKFTLTLAALERYQGDDWESLLVEEPEMPPRLYEVQAAEEDRLSGRYRDLVKELRLTPQVYNPFSR